MDGQQLGTVRAQVGLVAASKRVTVVLVRGSVASFLAPGCCDILCDLPIPNGDSGCQTFRSSYQFEKRFVNFGELARYWWVVGHEQKT